MPKHLALCRDSFDRRELLVLRSLRYVSLCPVNLGKDMEHTNRAHKDIKWTTLDVRRTAEVDELYPDGLQLADHDVFGLQIAMN